MVGEYIAWAVIVVVTVTVATIVRWVRSRDLYRRDPLKYRLF
jgi:hypothetical protein